MKIKRTVASSESEIETMLRNFATANASDDVDNEVDADDDEDLEDDAEVGDDEEDLDLEDGGEGDESSDEDGEDDDIDSDDEDGDDEDLDNEDLEDDVESSDDEDGDSDDEDLDLDGDDDGESSDDEDDDSDDEDSEDDSEDDSDDEGDEGDEGDEEDLDAEDEDEDVESSDDDDLDDIEAVLASADDVVEALIATGAVAVIIPTAPHDFQAVAAAFDAHEDEEVDASDDEDFDLDEDNEVDASDDDEDADSDDEGSDDEEVDASEDECDDDDDCDDCDDDTDASEDDDEEIVIDDEEDLDDEDGDDADASEDDLDDAEVDADEDENLDLDEEQLAPVVDIESIASADAEDVDLHLYVNADANDAWWNVTVKGIPAARIVKSSLDSKVHAFFLKDEFAANLKQAIASEGLSAVLEGAHAEYYANAYLQSELADQVRAEYEAEASDDYTAKTADLRDKFIDVVKLVTAGIAKNYFPEIGSPIKAALFEELDEAGLDNPAEPIEAAFAKANEAHFDAIFAKATELMDKSSEFLDDLRETIAGAGVINSQSEVDDGDEEETVATASFMTRLASGNLAASTKRGISRLADMK
jgi:hypothetical protein